MSALIDPSDIDASLDAVNSYILFCEELVVQSKQVTVYPNQKPWFTPNVKALLRERSVAFKSRNRERVISIRSEIRKAIQDSKVKYKRKLENVFATGNYIP